MAQLSLGGAVSSGRVYVRDDHGRFVREVEAGAQAAVQEIANQIASNAIAIAVTELRTRTGRYIGSIRPVTTGKTSAAAEATAPYAEILEEGSESHNIPNAFGRGEGFGFPEHRKDWSKGGWGFHPGTKPYHIMREAGELVSAIVPGILRDKLPGV